MKTKSCKICWKEIPKWLNNVCSQKCQNKKQELKEKEKKQIVKMKKSVSVSALSKKADTLWSEVVRMRGACEYCGKTEYLNAHHIFWRNNKSLRWETLNGICLCSGCHTFSSVFSAHKTPTEFTYWLESVRWKEYIDTLTEMAHIPMKVTPELLQDYIHTFKYKLEQWTFTNK